MEDGVEREGRGAPTCACVIEMCMHLGCFAALIRPEKDSQLLVSCSPTPVVE